MAHLKLDGGWKVTTLVDADFHLTLYVSNDDNSKITEVGEDLGSENEIGVRFTTEDIEAEYLDKEPKL